MVDTFEIFTVQQLSENHYNVKTVLTCNRTYTYCLYNYNNSSSGRLSRTPIQMLMYTEIHGLAHAQTRAL